MTVLFVHKQNLAILHIDSLLGMVLKHLPLKQTGFCFRVNVVARHLVFGGTPLETTVMQIVCWESMNMLSIVS